MSSYNRTALPRQPVRTVRSTPPFFLHVWHSEQIAISLASDVCLRWNELCWVRNDEAYALAWFEAIPSTLNFWAKFDPLITPPHWEAFGPPKDYFQSMWRWGYSSLTLPTSIHLALLGFVPLRPTRRYSTFPRFEVRILLLRMVSSCSFVRYSGEKSSIEGI